MTSAAHHSGFRIAGALRLGRAAVLALSVTAAPAMADVGDFVAPEDLEVRDHWLETYTGVDATRNAGFAYSGGAWGLGRNLSADGLRLRALIGYGLYDYDGTLVVHSVRVPVRFDGAVGLAEAMLGYRRHRGDLTLTGYLGLQYQEHQISPRDPFNSVQGSETGIKGIVEVWRNLGEKSWVSAAGAYSTAFDSFSLRASLGQRVHSKVSVGLEAKAFGNAEGAGGRGGALLRLHLGASAITASGGISGDLFSPERETSPYLSFGLYRKF